MAGAEEKALKSIILKLGIGGIFIIAVPSINRHVDWCRF